jgi:hypothetical protein
MREGMLFAVMLKQVERSAGMAAGSTLESARRYGRALLTQPEGGGYWLIVGVSRSVLFGAKWDNQAAHADRLVLMLAGPVASRKMDRGPVTNLFKPVSKKCYVAIKHYVSTPFMPEQSITRRKSSARHDCCGFAILFFIQSLRTAKSVSSWPLVSGGG